MASKQVLLKDIIKGTSVDAKIARRKLRAKFPGHDKGTTWSFSPAMVNQVKVLLGIVAKPSRKKSNTPAVQET